MAAAQAAENHGDTYINSNQNPLTKVTGGSRCTEFKDILPWNISQMIKKTLTINTRIVISGRSMETETTTFPYRRKAIVEQIPTSEEINKSKRAGQ